MHPITPYIGTAVFTAAVLHTFFTASIGKLEQHFPAGSMRRNFFHLMAEVEVVFGFWAFVFLGIYALLHGTGAAVSFLEQVDFTEGVYVFVIMVMAGTKPVLDLTGWLLGLPSRLLKKGNGRTYILYGSCLILGPLLGSLITEPAAMTVTALILQKEFFSKKLSPTFCYTTLALLFVNVSIGGALTHFAAPPIVMVAGKWGWDTGFMLQHFGVKACLTVICTTLAGIFFCQKDLRKVARQTAHGTTIRLETPLWIIAVHLFFVAAVVVYHQHSGFFLPLFLLFIGWTLVAKRYQSPLQIRGGLLVGFFLGGLVTLGSLQTWWLQPIFEHFSPTALFWSATALTAITDNAALTYLGSLVPTLTDPAKYALVAGAITGGGLTVIANAPNPIGYGLLKEYFGASGIKPLYLFLSALPPTLFAAAVFLL